MHAIRNLVLFLPLTLLAACGTPPAPGQAASHVSPPEIKTVKLERTECYGTCPAYTVEVFSDGTVKFQGKAHVKILGNQENKISPRDFAFLVAAIQNVNFFTLRTTYAGQEDGCTGVLTDAPTIQITVQTRERKKIVRYYTGCEGLEILGQIGALADTIDQVSGVLNWSPGDQTHPVVREPLDTESFRLHYLKAEDLVALLTDGQHHILSDSGAAVADKRNTVLFVRDAPLNLRNVRALIKQLDVPGNQVSPH